MDSSKAKPHQRQADIPGTPTPAEARVMFDQNAGMASVLTTDGVMTRDGVLNAVGVNRVTEGTPLMPGATPPWQITVRN